MSGGSVSSPVIFERNLSGVFFSKSFGYALRGVLYVALMQDELRKVQIDEIAVRLSVPRHFLGKVMQEVVRAGLLQSTKGPYGGYYLSETTLATPLIKLLEITDGMKQFNACALLFRSCDHAHPCPLHVEMDQIKSRLMAVLNETTIADLMNDDKKIFINSLTAS